MKKLGAIIFGIFYLIPNLFSQQVNYFSNDSYWRMQSICNYGFPCVLINEYGNYISGDTVVNDISYKKLVTYNISRTEWQSGEPQNPNCFIADTSLFLNCLIRQVDDKVFVKYGLSDETLMYDYDLQINDILPSTSVHPQTDLVVTAIDSILIQGEYRKTFQIEGSAQFTLIEGIGTNFGFLESVLPTLECSYSFLCYWENGAPVYINLDSQACNQVVGLKDLPETTLKIYPNPSENFATILGAKKILSIVDFSGKNLVNYASSNDLNGTIHLNLSLFDSGIYLIRCLMQNGREASIKVVRR
jgi:hypothetical protein